LTSAKARSLARSAVFMVPWSPNKASVALTYHLFFILA
jgi:hypothetical protein